MKHIYTHTRKTGLTSLLLMVLLFIGLEGRGQAYTSGYPNIDNITTTTATAYTSLDTDLYETSFVILPASSTAPTVQEVLDWSYSGVDGDGNPLTENTYGDIQPLNRGNIISDADTEYTFDITGLSSGTDYIAYFVSSTDWTTSTSIESTPTQVAFSTNAITESANYNSGYPAINNISTTTATAYTSLDTDLYETSFIILPASSTAPSVQEVLDWSYLGEDGDGNPLTDGTYGDIQPLNRGNIISDADTEYTFDITGLSSGTDYIAYFVSSTDWTTSTSIESTPTQVTFTTAETAPTISTYSPAQDATGISIDADLVLTFSVDIQKGTAPKYLNIYESDGTYVSTFNVENSDVSVSGNTLTISQSVLETDKSYYVIIDEGFVTSTSSVDFGGISDITEWAFTTVPAIVDPTFSPLSGATGISTSPTLTATFDDYSSVSLATGTHVLLYNVSTGGNFYDGVYGTASEITIENGNVLTINLSGMTIDDGTEYAVYIPESNVLYVDGAYYNGLQSTSKWTFTTTSPAPVTTFSPTEGATAVSIGTTITATYDKAILNTDGTEVTDSNVGDLITLTDSESAAIDFTATIDAAKQVITITPSSALPYNETISVSILPVENNFNVEQTESQTLSFTTANYNVWIGGGTTTSYTDATNYLDGSFSAGARTIVSSDATTTLSFSSNTEVPELVIMPLASVTINSGVTLTVEDEFLIQSDDTGCGSFINNGTLSITSSNINVEQYNMGTSQYSSLGSLVTSSSFSDAGGTGVIYSWDDDVTGNWAAQSSSSTMTPGEGYIITSSNELLYSGALNNNSSYTLYVEGTPNNSGYALKSNPYTASIDWESISTDDTTNIHNSFWIYLSDGTVGSYNGSTNTGTGLTGDVSLIPGGQAFWIRSNWVRDVTETIQGSLTVYQSNLVHNDKTYLKSTSTSSDENSLIRLVGVHNEISDENLIIFKDGASEGFDYYDTQKMFTSLSSQVLELYTLADSKKIVINSLPEIDTTVTKITLGYKAQVSDNYTIQLSEVQNLSNVTNVYLTDTDENTTVDLMETDYDFTSTAANRSDRFYLEILSSGVTTETSKDENSLEEHIKIYSYDKTVHITTETVQNASYTIYNINSQIIKTGILDENSDNMINLAKSGVYIVQVTNKQNSVSNKIVIK